MQLKPQLESLDTIWSERADGPYRPHRDGGYVGVVGIGHSIVAAPFYGASRLAAQLLPHDERDDFVRTGTFFTNAVVLAFLAVALALLARELSSSFSGAMLVALSYALGTFALPHAKTFFTEISSALFVTLGLLLAARWYRRGSRSLEYWCGFVAGFGVLVRVSAALFVPLFLLFLLVLAFRRDGAKRAFGTVVTFGAGGLIPMLLFFFFNWWRFGSILDLGYTDVPQSFPLSEGVANLFFRPGKSLFLFAPVIILGLIGLVVGIRRRFAILALMSSIVAANIILFSRFPSWAGDAAWGPRYQQIILPLMCAPAALLAGRRWFRPTIAVFGVVGALVPAMLGSLINFNIFFIESYQAGAGGATTDEAEWQPFLGHLELVPVGIRDVLDANHPDENERGEYSSDPTTHYGYFGWEARLDFWWLWVDPMGSSPALYLFLIPWGVSALLAVLLATDRVRVAERSSRLGWARSHQYLESTTDAKDQTDPAQS